MDLALDAVAHVDRMCRAAVWKSRAGEEVTLKLSISLRMSAPFIINWRALVEKRLKLGVETNNQ